MFCDDKAMSSKRADLDLIGEDGGGIGQSGKGLSGV